VVSGFPHLLAPGRIGAMETTNRIAMCPMGVNLAEDDGTVGDAQTAWFEARARGGAGLIIVGSVAIAYPTASFDRRQVAASDDVQLPGLRRLVEGIHRHGARVAAQLVHGGSNSLLDIAEGRALLVPSKKRPAAPDALSGMVTADEAADMMAPFASPDAAYRVREATDDDLAWVVDRFVDSARRVVAAGFDAIELHAGHGYLLHAFLSPHSNQRTDRWGGSIAARADLFVEVVRAVRAAVGPSVPVWARVGTTEAHRNPGQRIDDALVAMALGLDAGLDAIHVTAYGEPMVATGITDGHTPHEPGALLAHAARVRRELGCPVIAMGRLTPERAEAALADGAADLIAMGRALIADPDLPAKLAAGQRHRIRPCTYQYQCIGAIFRNRPVQCAMNPDAGRESATGAPAAETPRRVVVAGGGPAGLECARRLAERGHAVELREASDRLGGRLALAEQADRDLDGLLAWLIGSAEDAGVVLRTLAPVTGTVDADVLVWATGAEWGRDGSMGVDDLRPWLEGEAGLRDPVVIRGSSKAAVSLALHARHGGHAVQLVPDAPVLAPELGLPGRFRLVATTQRAGVVIGDRDDAAATDVWVGRASGPPPPDQLEVHVIGDAAGTGGLAEAFAAAAEVARRI
jgi:2,4-dienoyl-CoA reductase-like NADH-dependent reductase (Old Yellow Enzyme family)